MWNEQTVEALKTKWGDDSLSAEAIAAQLSTIAERPVTKNMVIGKARRLKLRPRARGIPHLYGRLSDEDRRARQARGMEAFKRKRHAVRNPHYAFGKGHENYTPVDPTPEVYDPQDVVRVSFIDREDGQCAWPIGDPRSPGFGCCGDVTVPGETYCPRHKGRAFEPRSDRPRRITYERMLFDRHITASKSADETQPDLVQVLCDEAVPA
ncbi:GcrA family cell cycle regulator [Hyphomicrobium sp. DY-1]|uniref:GcrA family cell cycle regulator n=1 Tax=Hyphomicrobium sp. DY-1 TaxID=3075650 RepID=UPI0039C15820